MRNVRRNDKQHQRQNLQAQKEAALTADELLPLLNRTKKPQPAANRIIEYTPATQLPKLSRTTRAG